MKVENQIEHGSDTAKESVWMKLIYLVIPFVGLGIMLCMWFAASNINTEAFPTPAEVLKQLADLMVHPLSGYTLLGHVAISLRRVCIALFFAMLAGIPLGILIGWNPMVRATLGTLFECIRPIPVLAWIPLMIMWFGIGEKAKIIMIFIGALMPIVVNSYTGIKLVSPLYLDVGRMFNASSQSQLLWKIVLPAALPTIFAGIRNATSMSLMVVLAAEMLAAKSGLGFMINRGMEAYNMKLVMSGMVAIGVTGAMLSVLTNLIERRICPWNSHIKSE